MCEVSRPLRLLLCQSISTVSCFVKCARIATRRNQVEYYGDEFLLQICIDLCRTLEHRSDIKLCPRSSTIRISLQDLKKPWCMHFC